MLRPIALFALSLGLSLSSPSAAQEMHAPAALTPAFDQFKSLVGTWTGTDSKGGKIQLTYELISNGSVLMERLKPSDEPEMITMYSLDGGKILLTHYCSAGNQPTMQSPAATATAGKYDFKFLRISGTKMPDEGHMVALSLTMPDKNHLTQAWTFLENGKSQTETFTFTRKS